MAEVETPEIDPIKELCKLLEESGLHVYWHRPGCSMKGCDCRARSLMRPQRMSDEAWKKLCDEGTAAREAEKAALSLLADALKALEVVGVIEGPEPGHPGSCGPEAGCDSLCVQAAWTSDKNAVVRKTKAALRKHLGLPEVPNF